MYVLVIIVFLFPSNQPIKLMEHTYQEREQCEYVARNFVAEYIKKYNVDPKEASRYKAICLTTMGE